MIQPSRTASTNRNVAAQVNCFMRRVHGLLKKFKCCVTSSTATTDGTQTVLSHLIISGSHRQTKALVSVIKMSHQQRHMAYHCILSITELHAATRSNLPTGYTKTLLPMCARMASPSVLTRFLNRHSGQHVAGQSVSE